MAIMALFTGNMSKAQYDALRREANWEADQPAGGIFHSASFDDAGHIHVADVWESAESLNAFVQERLIPAFQTLAIAPPEVAVYPVYNINAYQGVEAHRI